MSLLPLVLQLSQLMLVLQYLRVVASKASGAIGLDFVGPVVSVDAVSNTGIATVRVEGLSIKDEGSTVGTAGSISTLNFVGAGIAAAVPLEVMVQQSLSAGGVTNADVVALAIALG